jgi:hypothetical protein
VGNVEPVKVVARYVNGTLVKGFTQDFFPNKDRFHVTPADTQPGGTIEIFVKRLKAVFVVRDFQGDPYYNERKDFVKGESASGLKLELTFSDGEILAGSALLGYDPKRQGNFLVPADQMSNNTRVFAVSSAVKSVRQVYDHLIEDAPSPSAKA